MQKVLSVILAILAIAIIVPFGVANRHLVPVTLDPVRRLDSTLAYDVPLSLVIFVAFMAGLLIGAFVMWMSQSRWRQTARIRTREAYRWRSEADRLARERDERAAKGLPGPSAGAARAG